MKQRSFVPALVLAACVAGATGAAFGEPAQTAAADGKPSQMLSLNISELPIAKYLYELAAAAYAPEKFEPSENEKLILVEDGSNGFKALAVLVTFGAQKVAILAFSGTNPISPGDMIADTQIGLEYLVN